MKEISVKQASKMVLNRHEKNATIKLPYKIKMRDENKKIKKINTFSLKFLFNAIRLTDLDHPETEEKPKEVDITTIDSCYIFGSAVHPRFEKVTKRYLFGLYVSEKEQRVEPSDLDIICFVNNSYDMKHIKSMTSWDITINGAYYSTYTEKRYGFFDISYVPSSLVHNRYEENEDFLGHIREYGVCVMGSNIVGAKRYASWSHDTIKDKICCNISREENVTEKMIEKQIEDSKIQKRFEILDFQS